jgi:FkbM family methyltransferase
MYIFSNINLKTKKFNKYLHRYGINILINVLLIKLNIFNKNIFEISLPEVRYPIKLRAKTSDLKVMEQIFLDEDYNFPIDFEPKLIIDGGAYVGYSSVFFANRFPKTKIFSIEPEESNFKLLKENIRNYENIELINAGIWNKPTYLRIKDIGLGHFGFIVEEVQESEEFSFKAITIDEILRRSGYKEIDILKLDIEGSEKEVFSENYKKWLEKVKILIIELHDRIKPGCSEALYCAVNQYNFREIKKGEYIIFIRQ